VTDRPAAPADPETRRLWWVLAGLAVLLSLAEFRTVFLLHKPHLRQLAQAAWDVTLGQPHWREYQNRLLGPWLVRLSAGDAPGPFASAFVGALLLLTLAKNLLLLHLARLLGCGARRAAGAVLLGSALFLLLQDAQWLYLWDYLDVIVFSLFLYGVLAGRGSAWFALLFLPAILNRESGLFIALWLAMDGFTLREEGRWVFPRLRDRRRALLGACLLASGTAYILLTRSLLLVRETAPSFNPAFAAERPLHLGANLRTLAFVFSGPGWDGAVLLLPFLVLGGAVAALLLLLPRTDDRQAKLALLALAVILSITLVGLINETRIFSMLISFAVLPFLRSEPSQGGTP
jgi:hypothetical protein